MNVRTDKIHDLSPKRKLSLKEFRQYLSEVKALRLEIEQAVQVLLTIKPETHLEEKPITKSKHGGRRSAPN